MRFSCIFFLGILFTTHVQAQADTLSDVELINAFKAILKSDQSHVDEPEIRKTIFQRNFDTIIAITHIQGFPRLLGKKQKKKHKNLIQVGLTTTFMHMFMTNPKRILNSEVIQLLKVEIAKGNLRKEFLSNQLLVFLTDPRDKPWDNETKALFEQAKREWSIEFAKKSKLVRAKNKTH